MNGHNTDTRKGKNTRTAAMARNEERRRGVQHVHDAGTGEGKGEGEGEEKGEGEMKDIAMRPMSSRASSGSMTRETRAKTLQRLRRQCH